MQSLRTVTDAIFSNLWVSNIGAVVLHMVNAILLIVLYMTSEGSYTATMVTEIPVWTRDYENMTCFAKINETTSNICHLIHHKEDAFDVDVVWMLVAFAFISSIAHIFVLVIYDSYSQDIIERVNPIRWYEYSISASLMMSVVLIVMGSRDLFTHVMVFVAYFVVMMLGHHVETAVKRESRGVWSLLAISWLLYLAPWVLLFQAYARSVELSTSPPPDFVLAILIVMFLLFTSFGFLNFMYVLMPNTDYASMEGKYIFLSYLAKTLLIWILYGSIFTVEKLDVSD